MRDFIPAGSKMTPEEVAHFRAGVRPAVGGVVPDFIPDPKAKKTAPIGDPERGAAVAARAAHKNAAKGILTVVERAEENVAKFTVVELHSMLRSMSGHDRDVHVAVEAMGEARDELLDKFTTDPRVAEEVFAAVEDRDAPAPKPKPKKKKTTKES